MPATCNSMPWRENQVFCWDLSDWRGSNGVRVLLGGTTPGAEYLIDLID